MSIVLGPDHYGEAENRLVRVYRDTARHEIRHLNVSSALRGDFRDAHITGDQSAILPTDTQKNTVFAFAKEKGVNSIEAGLTLLNDEDHEQFAQLTPAYRERFGIPLIVSVRDVEKRHQILRTGWERMQNSPTQEHAAAISEVAKIANHRFDDLVADASPILRARAANLKATPSLSSRREPAR